VNDRREPYLEIRVNGVARSKGSLQLSNRSTGRIAGDPREREWAAIVAAAARRAIAGKPMVARGVPVYVVLEFVMATESVTQNGAGAADLDKLQRSILDALTRAKVYDDDVQVTEIRACKRISQPNELPGVEITVWVA
jgi:Holliday junction resolvase RusA-like endonuclease